jgi:hypothetical protein
MKHSLAYIAFACLVAMSNAATVTFNVVAPGATDVQVSVNGQQTKLEAKDADVPLFSGQMDAPDKANYKVRKTNAIDHSFTLYFTWNKC